MATSPTPSLDSIRGINSIESYGEHNGYLSDSPLTLSGSSPPVSDSAICDEFTTTNVNSNNQHHPISASVSSSSSSSSSGLSGCGSTSSAESSASSNGGGSSNGVIGSNLSNISVSGGGKESSCNDPSSNSSNSNMSTNTSNGTGTPVRCTACKSKQSDAVAKCFECVSFLCANCVTAHEFMHCFHGHNVSLMKGFNESQNVNCNGNNSPASIIVSTNNPASTDFNYSSSLTMMLQQQQQQQHKHQNHSSLTQLSKIVLNSHAAAVNANTVSVFSDSNEQHHEHRNDDLFASVVPTLRSQQQLFCQRHKHELLKFNCRTCCTLVCKDCVISDHSSGLHEFEHVQEHTLPSIASTNGSAPQNTSDNVVQSLLADLRGRIGEMVSVVSSSDNSIGKIKAQYQKAHNEVNETYQFFCSMLDERKQELLKELENLYNTKITSNNAWLQRSKELIEKAIQTCDTIERAPKAHSVTDVLMLRKTVELQLQTALQDMHLPFEMEFISNYQSIQAGVRNTFGYIRSTAASIDGVCGGVAVNNNQKQPPIARPTQSSSNSSSSSVASASHLTAGLGFGTSLMDNSYGNSVNINGTVSGGGFLSGRGVLNHHHYGASNNQSTGSGFEDIIPRRFQTGSSAVNAVAVSPFMGVTGVNPYEKWSNGGSDNIFSTADTFSSTQLLNSLTNATTSVGSTALGNNTLSTLNLNVVNSSSDPLMDLTSKLISVSSYPPKSQIKRQKMIYHCKFGEFGVLEGQFTEPSGVAVNAQNDIIVADTNNHRIQIFDKEGRFKFHFGECGKRDSQLLYPNRVAVVRTSGDIIVTERSPTHQIQIYNQYGQFVRKFGANILQHPRGVTVDNKGRIIVVECKVMRVIIFDQNGEVLHKFGCSKHLEFPNGVVVNDKQEIFISDNRAHCVKVFNYEGQYLRQIGGEGVTNYPIGVGINSNGEILIADNHNNFNLTIFTQDGQLVSALESKVKHAQCFDVALMDDGSVVLASKDYRLYIYRYVQVPPILL